MCFSAAASFASAGVLLSLGLANLLQIVYCANKQRMSLRQRATLGSVAAIPLIFGAHQLSEGFVWTDFDNEHAVRCFAYTAYIFWPCYISLCLCLVEWTRTDFASSTNATNHWGDWPRLWKPKLRQRILAFHVVLAFALLAVVVGEMIQNDPNTVKANNGRLQYEGWGLENDALDIMGSIIYVYCVVGSLAVSSLRYSTLFGGCVLISLIASVALWENQFPSTWCFFSAVLSVMVLFIVWSELQLYKREPEPVDKSEVMKQSKSKHLNDSDDAV